METTLTTSPMLGPVQLAGQVVEYEVVPLPLVRSGVRGVALHENRVLISLGLGPDQARRQRRPARGVLLSLPGVSGWYALEVDRLGTLGQLRRAPPSTATESAWWVRALDEQDRPHFWFDAEAFVRALLAPLPTLATSSR